MADEADYAKASEELALEVALKNRSTSLVLEPNGICHNPLCENVLEKVVVDGKLVDKRLYCDSRCAGEHERIRKTRGAY